MRRVKTGWVAQREGGESWELHGVTADGVYLATSSGCIYFHLTGTTDDEAGPRMEIPADASLLRELATALEEMAQWCDRGRMGGFHQ